MKLLAIVGSPRKGRATDTLVDKAIEGTESVVSGCTIKKINLLEHDIRFCTNCLTCVKSKTKEPISKCAIRDDMDSINQDLLASDLLIFGTPVHMGFAAGVMTTWFYV